MRGEILIICILFVGLFFVLQYTGQHNDGFFDFPDNTPFVKESQNKVAGITNLVNLIDPSIAVGKSEIDNAIGTLFGQPSDSTHSLERVVPEQSPNAVPGTIVRAKSCEAAPNTCAAFNDPTFAANCGMSFDINGTKTNGDPHMGGLYISSSDRADQTDKAADVLATGSAPYDPYKVYQPTLGTAARGTFGITKDSCIVVKEKVDCAAKQTFGSPNCTQCYTSQNFSRVGPGTGRLPSKLYLVGKGSFYVWTSNIPAENKITYGNATLSTTPVVVNIPGSSEGITFIIAVAPQPSPVYIAGYIEGPTPQGSFKLDLMSMIQSDTVTNAKARISGTIMVNGFRCVTIIPGSGKTSIRLSCLMPFTFLNMYDGDALTCDNGPIIMKESSATFLESDPCFGKANQPGNYKLECLQSRWTDMGGTDKGTGYPTTKAKADAIQKDAAGNPLKIDIIVDNLSVIMRRALTGKDANNVPLSIPDWNTASMYATGVPINTPCDGPGAGTTACAAYIYRNEGINSHVGPTYSAPSSRAHLKENFSDGSDGPDGSDGSKESEGSKETFENQTPYHHPYPNTSIDPNKPSGAAFAAQFGENIPALKNQYDWITNVANDNSIKNIHRAPYVKAAYDINLKEPTMGSEDFDVRIPANQPTKSYAEMKAVCEAKGQRLCQSSELCNMQTRTVNNPGITASFPGDNWIAVGDSDNEWLTLNRADNRYCKTHTEVAGGKPGWGPTQNPGSWERLAKCCSGSASVFGRYISLGYDHYECLNLGEIAVYTDDSISSNVITPQTPGSKSSGYGWGDVFPMRNFVDGNENSFVHTSCYDVPWIQIDLGKVTPIFRIVVKNRTDCCKERILGTILYVSNQNGAIYASEKIQTVSDTYTWFPPNPRVYADLPLGSPPPPRQTVYGDNGTVSCNRYCRGLYGGPWNGELPREWNGAKCAGYDPRIGGCDVNFPRYPGAGCVCEKDGKGWLQGSPW